MPKASANNPSRDRAAIAYETSDVPVGGMAALVIGFVILGIIIWIVTWKLMNGYAEKSRLTDQPRSLVTSDRSISRNAPLLQPTPQHDQSAEQDLRELRHKDDEVFEHLGWTRDPQTGEFVPPAALVDLVAKRKGGNR